MDIAASYDFGDRSCGDGVTTEFKERIGAVEVGQAIEIVVREPGAKVDLPAMARLLGHEIVAEQTDGSALRLTVKRAR